MVACRKRSNDKRLKKTCLARRCGIYIEEFLIAICESSSILTSHFIIILLFYSGWNKGYYFQSSSPLHLQLENVCRQFSSSCFKVITYFKKTSPSSMTQFNFACICQSKSFFCRSLLKVCGRAFS